MDIDDRPAQRAVGQLRADVESLKRHMAVLRAETKD
jgi:multidrug resistance efflux pump